jgi:hypothetical protein
MAEQITCDQCGQTDDHPKAHFMDGRTVHHDCMDVREEALARSAGERQAKIVDACKGGLKGTSLREFIQEGSAA